MTETVAMLSDLTLDAVRAESIRAHLKHHRPDEGSGSLFDGGLTVLSRLAALVEEVGEVADELIPAISQKFEDDPLFTLVAETRALGRVGRRLTYDGDGESGLTGTGVRELPPRVDRTKLVKELIQVANVALSWAQQIEDGSRRS